MISGTAPAYNLPGSPDKTADAAEVLQELIDTGYIKVDASKGKITVERSVLEVLKSNGFAFDSIHSTQSARSCSSTTGSGTGSGE